MFKLISLLVAYFSFVNGADILLLSSVASISHSLWYGKLSYLLASNGHKVVVLDTDKNFFEHPNITHYHMKGGYGWLRQNEELVKNDPNGLEVLIESHSTTDMIIMLTDPSFLDCDKLLKSQETQQFMKDYKGKKFDAIVADGFCESFFGFVSHFNNPPLIAATPYLEMIASDWVGLFDNPAYVPYHLTSLSTKMSFIERIKNTYYHCLSYYMVRTIQMDENDKVIKDIFGPNTPSLKEILEKNLALVMTGYSYVLQGAKPLPHSYISIPAFHAEKPKPLPKDIKKFLDGAKEGAILFSMGSNFKSILMSEERREMFLSIFKNIPQRVIWKLEIENDTNIPSNVMITKWLPQNDILGHPNVKAFISHGGLLGTQEAVYHGVPILGLPLMYDQWHNMERLEKHGVAIKLNYKFLNKQYVAKQIDKIINDPSYYYNMKKLSAAFNDQPETPRERALFWIEYVIRRSNDKTNHLRTHSLDLEWYQRLLLDVFAFLALCLLIIYYTVKTILKCILNIICGSKKKDNIDVRKKKQ